MNKKYFFRLVDSLLRKGGFSYLCSPPLIWKDQSIHMDFLILIIEALGLFSQPDQDMGRLEGKK